MRGRKLQIGETRVLIPFRDPLIECSLYAVGSGRQGGVHGNIVRAIPVEAAVEKMHSPGWNDARRLKMRLLIQIMRWSGMALVDAVCLPRVELVKRTISSRRHKTDKWFTAPIREPLAAHLY